MKVGDLVTGRDRSYERSIYQITEITEDLKLFAILKSLSGYVPQKTETPRPIGWAHEFRPATEEEINISSSGPVVWDKRDAWLRELNHPSFPMDQKSPVNVVIVDYHQRLE